MPLCNQTWIVDVIMCVGLLNECAQVGETHYGDCLVFVLSYWVSRLQTEELRNYMYPTPNFYCHVFVLLI